eukprot:jgi/Ulvmu1/5192/UM021_0209.1
MLSEDSIRSLTSTAACLILALAGAYSVALHLRQKTSTASRPHPDKVKRRFTERMWSWISQEQAIDDSGMLSELGSPDRNGVYSCCSSDGQTLFIRSNQAKSGFEWSIEKLVWFPTSQVLGNDMALCEENQILIRRLEAEMRLLTSSVSSLSTTTSIITHPPELDLPRSLRHPEIISGDVVVPEEFRCPLGSAVMAQPVVTPAGLTFDRNNIEQWISRFGTDPATTAPLTCQQLYPNLALRDLIQGFVVQHGDKLDPELLRRVSKDCVGATVSCGNHSTEAGSLPLLAVANDNPALGTLPPAAFVIGRSTSQVAVSVDGSRCSPLDAISSSDVEVTNRDPSDRIGVAAVVQDASSCGV